MNDIILGHVKHSKRIAPAIPSGRLHSHELTVVISGSMVYRIREAEYTVGPKDIIFIPKDTPRERLASDAECDYVSFSFTSTRPEIPTLLSGACQSEVVLLISAIDKILAKPHLTRTNEIAALVGVILSILEDYARAEKMSPVTREILDYLHSHFRERITLEDVGRLTFFSPIYCETLFRREVERPIVDYVIDLRITEAEKLIIEDALSLTEISREVGFEDYNYFSRTFKRRTGYTPSQYRRQARS